MKKVILMVAVALAALSCANKEAEKAEEAQEPAAVEVAAPCCEEAAKCEEAPAQEETEAQKQASLIERAVELGHDVANEVEKNK